MNTKAISSQTTLSDASHWRKYFFFLYFDWNFKAKCVKWMIQLTIFLYSEHGVTSGRYHRIELHVIAANGTLHVLLLGWWYNSLRDLHGTFTAVLVLLWQNTQWNETMKLTLIALFVVGWGLLEIKWTIYLMPYWIYCLFLRISPSCCPITSQF